MARPRRATGGTSWQDIQAGLQAVAAAAAADGRVNRANDVVDALRSPSTTPPPPPGATTCPAESSNSPPPPFPFRNVSRLGSDDDDDDDDDENGAGAGAGAAPHTRPPDHAAVANNHVIPSTAASNGGFLSPPRRPPSPPAILFASPPRAAANGLHRTRRPSSPHTANAHIQPASDVPPPATSFNPEWTQCPKCSFQLRSLRYMERQFHMRACDPVHFAQILGEDAEFQAFLEYLEGTRATPAVDWVRCPVCQFRPRTGQWTGFEKQFHMRACDAHFFERELQQDKRFQQYLAYLQGTQPTPTIMRRVANGEADDAPGLVQKDAEMIPARKQQDWRAFYRNVEERIAPVYVGVSVFRNDHRWCNIQVGRGLFASESFGLDVLVHAIVRCDVLPMTSLKNLLRRRRLPEDAIIQIGELGVLDHNIRSKDDLVNRSVSFCEWYAMNHSHEPNVRMYRKGTPSDIRIEWRTIRPVSKDEELCYDYFGKGLKWCDAGWN